MHNVIYLQILRVHPFTGLDYWTGLLDSGFFFCFLMFLLPDLTKKCFQVVTNTFTTRQKTCTLITKTALNLSAVCYQKKISYC